MKDEIQNIIDSKAKEYKFDNINSIAKYIGYENQYQLRAITLGKWCASCWTYLETIENNLDINNLPVYEDVINNLPIYEGVI